MSEQEFLGGRVVKRTLPVIAPSATPGTPARTARRTARRSVPTTGTPVLKRLLLPQGELAQFYDGDEPMRYIAVIELRPGTVRGNHYHKAKVEWIYVVSGEILVSVRDPESGASDSFPLEAGDIAVVRPGIAHALQPRRAGYAIEFSPSRFDPADTFKSPATPD